jgi:hypothetical protein
MTLDVGFQLHEARLGGGLEVTVEFLDGGEGPGFRPGLDIGSAV